jgi:hypothetical protein
VSVIDFPARLARIRVYAQSPGGQLTGVLHGGEVDIELAFVGNSYYRFTEPELEHQIEGLCRLLVAGWRREYWAAFSELQGYEVTGEVPPADEATRRYRELRDSISVSGACSDGRIRVSFDAGREGWRLRIEPGTLATLTEEQFLAATHEAAQDLGRDHRETMLRIRDECFPPPETLPRW